MLSPFFQVSSAAESEAETQLPDVRGKTDTVNAARYVLTGSTDSPYPRVPKEFITWLNDVKGLAKPTVAMYRHDISQVSSKPLQTLYFFLLKQVNVTIVTKCLSNE